MTAREEAATAVAKAYHLRPRDSWESLVDAIPADVLVRYAIERGVLRRTHYRAEYGYEVNLYDAEDDTEVADDTALYRLAGAS